MVLEKGGIRAMQTAIEEFIQYLENIKKASRNTVLSYRRDLLQLAAYLESQGITEPAKVTRTSLNSYVLYLEGKGKAATSISRMMAFTFSAAACCA